MHFCQSVRASFSERILRDMTAWRKRRWTSLDETRVAMGMAAREEEAAPRRVAQLCPAHGRLGSPIRPGQPAVRHWL